MDQAKQAGQNQLPTHAYEWAIGLPSTHSLRAQNKSQKRGAFLGAQLVAIQIPRQPDITPRFTTNSPHQNQQKLSYHPTKSHFHHARKKTAKNTPAILPQRASSRKL
jgi:hypothetical protein